MKVAITGGTGFIGAELVKRCVARGDSVRVLTRGGRELPPGAQPFVADLTSPNPSLQRFLDDADVLYHCAGEIGNELLMQALHVDGTRRLIDSASGCIGHWVQLSSVGAYGPQRIGIVSEDSVEAPAGAYETSKTMADALVAAAAREGAFSSSILRPSTVFGPAMPNRSLRQWIAAIRRGWFFFIGKPGAMANYVHVSSVVDALLLCGTAAPARGRVFIVSEAVSVEEFVKIICDESGCATPRIRLPEALAYGISAAGETLSERFPLKRSRIEALTSRACYDSSRLRNELHWKPSVPLEEGLRDFVSRLVIRGE